MHRAVSRTFQFLALLLLALMLTACGGEGDDGNMEHDHVAMPEVIDPVNPEPESDPNMPDAELEPQPEPNPNPEAQPQPGPVDPIRQAIEEYTCTDERERVVDFVSLVDHDTAAPIAWDGMPFQVYVSSSFSDAHELLEAIAEEAERIHTYLGYEIFVAGDVIPMVDIAFSDIHAVASEAALLPADYEIPFYCCDTRPGKAGQAQVLTRTAVLSPNPGSARHIIMHELYHLLGFDHPDGDGSEGVPMSDVLYSGRLPTVEESIMGIDGRIPTYSTALDLAKLACIYD